MKRTTVYLSEEVDVELTRLAKEKNTSKAALVRQAVDTLVNTSATAAMLMDTPNKTETLPAWVGSVSNGHLDDVDQLDKHLGELYEADYREAIERQESREYSG